jgi:hypothetical protein
LTPVSSVVQIVLPSGISPDSRRLAGTTAPARVCRAGGAVRFTQTPPHPLLCAGGHLAQVGRPDSEQDTRPRPSAAAASHLWLEPVQRAECCLSPRSAALSVLGPACGRTRLICGWPWRSGRWGLTHAFGGVWVCPMGRWLWALGTPLPRNPLAAARSLLPHTLMPCCSGELAPRGSHYWRALYS